MNICIANRGLSALKFIISMREWLSNEPNAYNIRLFGFITPTDISCRYKYITLLDTPIYTDNEAIYTDMDDIIRNCQKIGITHLFPELVILVVFGMVFKQKHMPKTIQF